MRVKCCRNIFSCSNAFVRILANSVWDSRQYYWLKVLIPQANINAEGADDEIWDEVVVKIVQVVVVVVKCYWR